MNAPLPVDGRSFLANVPLFRDLAAEDMDRIATHTRPVRARRGEILFHRGEHAEGFYVLIYGQVKLSFVSARGNEKVVDVRGPGETFGEAVMFMEHPAVVTAHVLNDCLLLMVPRSAVFEELERDPRFARRMLAGLSKRLHYLMGELESASMRFGSQRLVSYLLNDCESSLGGDAVLQVRLPTSKGEVASRLNLTRQHFSRILRELTAEGLIEVRGRTVRICDVNRLRGWED